jgi:hypothetical protein
MTSTMQVEPHVEALRAELASLASLGDEQVATAAERLSQALSSTLGLRLLAVLSEAALEVSSQLPSGHVEVHLAGQEPSLVYVESEGAAQPPPAEDGLTARITLRLPDSLKASLEAAASREGVSVNAWIVKALARGLSNAAVSRIGSRLTGFGQS